MIIISRLCTFPADEADYMYNVLIARNSHCPGIVGLSGPIMLLFFRKHFQGEQSNVSRNRGGS